MEDVENFLKELVRLRLKASVEKDTYVECLEALLGQGFSPRDESRWMRSLAETLLSMGESRFAETVFRDALKRDPGLPHAAQLRQRLKV
jgi:hypothetical protein